MSVGSRRRRVMKAMEGGIDEHKIGKAPGRYR